METILTLRNALNQGTARESAIGHKLDSLLKLSDTRARNNKMTLMHYLCKVQQVEYEKEIEEWTYQGWNKRHDEWVAADLLQKYTDEDPQKPLVQGGRSEKNPRPNRKIKTGKSTGRGKKGNPESIIKLVKLPRTPNVDDILNKYYELRVMDINQLRETIQEILSGLCFYFNEALPTKLLYKNERKQYDEARLEHIPPSTVYGAEHFLRLFVKLPEILRCAKIEEEALLNLHPKLLDILEFLETNQSTFFLSTYYTPEGLMIKLEH